jgi:hypothetical protein
VECKAAAKSASVKEFLIKRKDKAKKARQWQRPPMSPEFARLRKDNFRVTN